MCCDSWKTYTTKKQFLIVVGLCVFCSLGVIQLISGSFFASIMDTIQSKSRDTFFEQAQTNMKNVVKDNVDYYDQRFLGTIENCLNAVAGSYAETARSDFPYNTTTVPSFMDYVQTMAPPVVYDIRYQTNVSFTHGSYNIYGKTPADIPSFSESLRATIGRIASIDRVAIVAHNHAPSCLSVYVGDDESNVYFEYPGATTANPAAYNFKSEEWWIDSKATQGEYVFSDLYWDPYVNTTMITVSLSVHNRATGGYIGSVGIDMTLDYLYNDVSSVKYYDSRSVLFTTTSRTIIVDSKNPNSSPSKPITSIINSETVDKIVAEDTYFGETNGMFLQTQKLQTANKEYILALIVSESSVMTYYENLNRDQQSMRSSTGGLLAGVGVAILVVTLAVSLWLGNSLATPLQAAIDMATKFARNLGTSNLFAGIKRTVTKGAIYESAQFAEQLNGFVEMVQKQRDDNSRDQQTSTFGENTFQDQLPPPPEYKDIDDGKHDAKRDGKEELPSVRLAMITPIVPMGIHYPSGVVPTLQPIHGVLPGAVPSAPPSAPPAYDAH